MKMPALLRSETTRMMLVGFLIGTAGIAATAVATPSVAASTIAAR
jgi:hypothetical protein